MQDKSFLFEKLFQRKYLVRSDICTAYCERSNCLRICKPQLKVIWCYEDKKIAPFTLSRFLDNDDIGSGERVNQINWKSKFIPFKPECFANTCQFRTFYCPPCCYANQTMGNSRIIYHNLLRCWDLYWYYCDERNIKLVHFPCGSTMT